VPKCTACSLGSEGLPLEGQFDYIIVGAGSAGAALAARLSENPKNRVLLLEAGGSDANLKIAMPILYYQALSDPRLNWNYETEPEPNLEGRSIRWPRGRVVGFEAADAGRGQSGPVGVSRISHPNLLSVAFVQSCLALGFPENQGFNGPSQYGAGMFELSVRSGRRSSTGRAYLYPARRRSNLRIEANAQCDRIVFDNQRAVAVRYFQGHVARIAYAEAEVILCAGAIGSPEILMRSGIGPGEVIQRVGGEVIRAVPAVGRNLQDHFQARLSFRAKGGHSLNLRRHQLAWLLGSSFRYLAGRSGPLAVGAGEAGLFSTISTQAGRPELQAHFLPFSTDLPGRALHSWDGFTVSVCQLRPESRGSVEIVSPECDVRPKIVANYLSTAGDRASVVSGIKLMRRIAEAAPLAANVVEELEPGRGCSTDEELLAYARGRGGTIFHPCGTCAIGPSESAVLDPDLRLHGIDRLRVADASAMPTIISGNTNAASIMIGERAADLIQRR
jgi:choline dehydrogenase